MPENKYFGIIIMVFICLIGIVIPNELYNDETNNTSTKDILISDIMLSTDDKSLDRSFLSWIYDNYGEDKLLKLDEEIKNGNYSKNIWHKITGNSYLVLNDLYYDRYSKIDNIKIIDKYGASTMSFVGDVSLADNWYIMPKYDERNNGIYGIIDKELVDIMTGSDIMVANNEFTISNRGEKMPGKMYTFRSSPERLTIYEEMGINLVTLANNHIYDFGDDAFYDTINSLNEYKIPYIGAGKNIDEAKRPYYFILNGYKIAFLNATRAEKNIMTPEATNNRGGVFRCYDPTALIDQIKSVKTNSDYVITLIHWGKEDSHSLEDVQMDTAKKYIDAGSDVVIGSHAHVLQGMEFYNNKLIVYNLGDYIFNDETKDTGLFQIKLNDNGIMDYYFIPALEKDEYVTILKDTEKQRVIDELNNLNINAIIDNLGQIKST